MVDRYGWNAAAEHPLAAEHALVSETLEAASANQGWSFDMLVNTEPGRAMKQTAGDARVRCIQALGERGWYLMTRAAEIAGPNEQDLDTDGRRAQRDDTRQAGERCLRVAERLTEPTLPFTPADWHTITGRLATAFESEIDCPITFGPYATALETWAKKNALDEALTALLRRLQAYFEAVGDRSAVRYQRRLADLTGDTGVCPVAAGEPWADAVLSDLASLPAETAEAWNTLLFHCEEADGGKPKAKWRKKTEALLDAIDTEQLTEFLARWFPLAAEPRPLSEEEAERAEAGREHTLQIGSDDLLKGLAWCAGLRPGREIARACSALALACFKKVPGIGPKAPKVGNAAVWALGEQPGMDGVGQLAILKVKVRNRNVQKGIAKALAATAERVGITADELEEMGVPEYGLTDIGRLERTLGDFTAVLEVTGTSSTTLTWLKADGAVQKSVPKAVKDDHADDLKELKAAAKDIQKMLPVQRERIDTLFLEQRSWPMGDWRDRYLNHPLVGYHARRIIWRFTAGDAHTDAIWHDDGLIDAAGTPFTPADTATVSLWHPIGEPLEQVLAWRERLEERGISQPFKQAYREVYVLTDAERTTGIYSNRYAAHIIRQHQFNALCGARGWKNTLQLMVDDSFPPANRVLPKWGLRAEFWADGIGDNYGVDTNETGTFLRLATDQVRFYADDTPVSGGGGTGGARGQASAEPLALDAVPPLVFSEIMRDVDLFVGVASVGNDPTWNDGGPDGAFRDYWHSYSFGALSETANTRRTVLERLVPRLKIADRCELEKRFLRVRGELRTYKIHLGSGNILMEPNDQYLCIVKGRSASKSADAVMLPFEGDGTLSVILSKAFMLAADTKIKDASILSQIKS